MLLAAVGHRGGPRGDRPAEGGRLEGRRPGPARLGGAIRRRLWRGRLLSRVAGARGAADSAVRARAFSLVLRNTALTSGFALQGGAGVRDGGGGPLPSGEDSLERGGGCELTRRPSSAVDPSPAPHAPSTQPVGPSPPGTSSAMLLPFSKIWSSFVTRWPSAVISLRAAPGFV